jgi:hypothetical protein
MRFDAPAVQHIATLIIPRAALADLCLAGVVLMVLLSPSALSAQRIGSLELRWDNDLFAVRGAGAPPDYDYTQGLELGVNFDAAPGWLISENRSPHEGLTTRIALGQRIYTPRRDAADPVPGERPYAAWLYGRATLEARDGPAEHSLGIEIGITGPAALGEEVQNGVHHLLGSTPQLGWAHQLGTEVAAVATYGIGWPVMLAGVQLTPAAEVGLGTRWSGAAIALGATVGRTASGKRGLYADASVRQDWVLRNLFVDGNTFGPGSTAERIPFVTGATVGAGYRFARWSAAYEFTIRSPEYTAQPAPHPYGSLMLTWYASREDRDPTPLGKPPNSRGTRR